MLPFLGGSVGLGFRVSSSIINVGPKIQALNGCGTLKPDSWGTWTLKVIVGASTHAT